MKQRLERSWEYIVILLLSFPPFLWFANGYVLLGHDSGFRIDYMAQLPNLFYSWDPKNNFGVDWSIFKGFLVTQFPETVLSFITHSFAVGEKLSLIFWFAVMGIGMLIFVRSIFPEPKYRFFRLFTSIFYMYNFFILNGWSIGERAKFSLYAAMPLGLLLVYNVFVRNKPVIRSGIVFGLLYFFLNGGGVPPLYGGTIIVIGLVFIYFVCQRVKKFGREGLLFSIRALISFVVPFLFLNAYYIVPNIFLLKNSYTSALGIQGGINGLIAWERVISKNASFVNLLRLQGMPNWYDNPWHPYARYFLNNPLLIIGSFIPIVSIIFGTISFRLKGSSKEQSYLLKTLFIILPVGLLFAMGTHPPTGIFYEFAMKKIPGFAMFRSSFYKFAPAVWFPMIVLSGYYIGQLIDRLFLTKYLRWMGYAVCILALLLYHFPYFTADAFIVTNDFTTRVRVPAYVSDFSSRAEQMIPQASRILILPALDINYINLPIDSYLWGFFSLDILPRSILTKSIIANDSNDLIVQSLYDAIYRGDAVRMKQLISILGVQYIYWRGDVKLTEKTKAEFPPGPVKQFIDAQPDIVNVLHSGPWTLYRIGTSITSDIFIPDRVDAYQGSPQSAVYLIESFGDLRHSFVEINDNFETQYQDIYKAADCIQCQENEFQKLVESITLPHQRLTPASPLFFLEKARQEGLIKNTTQFPKERIDVDVATAQNYLSYFRDLGDSKYLTVYDAYITDAVNHWRELAGTDKNNYGIRLLAYMTAQKTSLHGDVLNKVEQMSKEVESNIWKTDGIAYRYIITFEKDFEYELITSNGGDVSIDGILHASGSFVRLTKGLHRIEVSKQSPGKNTIPYVFFKRSNIGVYSGASVSFTRVNPTMYTAHITHNDTTPFLLVLKEHYSPQWEIGIANTKHVLVDGFANGWIMDKEGTYDVTIYYAPQRIFMVGLVITGVALLISGIFLSLHRQKRGHS